MTANAWLSGWQRPTGGGLWHFFNPVHSLCWRWELEEWRQGRSFSDSQPPEAECCARCYKRSKRLGYTEATTV